MKVLQINMEKSFDLNQIQITPSSSHSNSPSPPPPPPLQNGDVPLNLLGILPSEIPQDFLNRITNLTHVEAEIDGKRVPQIRIEFGDNTTDNLYNENMEGEAIDLGGYHQGHNAVTVLDLDDQGVPETGIQASCNRCPKKLVLTELLTHSHVVRGDYSQNSFNNGNPCTAIAAVAIVCASKCDVHLFKTKAVNDILLWGNDLYTKRRLQLQTLQLNLTATEVAGPYLDNITINVDEEKSMNGLLDIVTGPEDLPRLWKSLKEFLDSDLDGAGNGTGSGSAAEDKKFAILTANFLSMALIVQGNWVFLFDSHSRDEYGRPSYDIHDGAACLMSFSRDLAARAIAEHVFYNCEFTGPSVHIDNVSSEDLQYFQYSITPVTIS